MLGGEAQHQLSARRWLVDDHNDAPVDRCVGEESFDRRLVVTDRAFEHLDTVAPDRLGVLVFRGNNA